MSDVRVVWMPERALPVLEKPTALESPYLLLPIERTEDGAVVVRVGDLRFRRGEWGYAVVWRVPTEDNMLADHVAVALLTAAERAMEGESDG